MLKLSELVRNRLKDASIKQTIATVVLVTFRRASNFVVGFLLAGILGASAYGSYSFVISTINIAQTICFLGLDVFLVREIARYAAQQDYATARGVIRFSLFGMIGATSLVAASILGLGMLVDAEAWPQLSLFSRTAPIILPLIVAMRFAQAILRGLQKPATGLMPEFVIRPLLIITLILVLSSSLDEITTEQALWIFAGSTALAIIAAYVFLLTRLPSEARVAGSVMALGPWTWASASLFYIFFLHALYADAAVVFLGLLSTAEETARYRLGFMMSSLIPFLMTAINTSLGPIVSSHLAEGRKGELQELLNLLTRICFIFGAVLGVAAFILGDRVLSYFGEEYLAGHDILLILVVSQLVNLAIGPAMTVLTMSGNEAKAARGITFVALLSLLLNPILISLWGGIGAALSTAAGQMALNLYLLRALAQHVGVSTSLFGRQTVGSVRASHKD